MENATKALLIAGTVLIAIVMVSIAVYLYTLYSNQADEYNATMSAVELEKFNSKFEIYVGRTDITPQEIVSVVNLSKEYNGEVNVYVSGSLLSFTSSNTQENFIKNTQSKTFSCTFSNSNPVYDTNGKITKIKFTQNAG